MARVVTGVENATNGPGGAGREREMASAVEIAREYFPDTPEQELFDIIWSETGYPSFWRKEDGNTPEECFRNQLAEAKRKRDNNEPIEELSVDQCPPLNLEGYWKKK